MFSRLFFVLILYIFAKTTIEKEQLSGGVFLCDSGLPYGESSFQLLIFNAMQKIICRTIVVLATWWLRNGGPIFVDPCPWK